MAGRNLGWRKYRWSKQELERLYWRERMSCSAIAKAYGLSYSTIRNALKELGISSKTHSEAVGKGALNHNWRGGKSHTGAGYTVIYKPNHPRAMGKHKGKGIYVLEHILVWEETHHQLLPEGWLIHHLNGVKNDNHPQNLLALTKRGHSPALTLKGVQKRLREVEAQLAQQRLC